MVHDHHRVMQCGGNYTTNTHGRLREGIWRVPTDEDRHTVQVATWNLSKVIEEGYD